MTEKEFLASYNPDQYKKPSVTADILVFTMNESHSLELLLIKRGGHPFAGKWAIPGGFVNLEESVDDAAKRELQEETGVSDIYLEQLYTFGEVDRDPRMRVISVAYIALVPKEKLQFAAGDDASEAKLFEISLDNWELKFKSEDGTKLNVNDLAFDHEKIIQMGLKRLAGKLDYTDIAFELLEDKHCFSIYELQQIHEAIKGKALNASNFRRVFKSRYLNEGIVTELNETSTKHSAREAKCYRFNG